MHSKNSSFKIASFYDGRAGHEKQTDGIIAKISEKRAVEIKKISVTRPCIGGQILLWLDYFSSNFKILNQDLSDYDLFLGTGTHVHLQMLLYKKKFHKPVATCMTPSSLIIDDFDLIFSPKHDGLNESKNVFTTIGPPNGNSDLKQHNEKRLLILLGGVDEKSHYWISGDIVFFVNRLISENRDKEIVISSSPRTPAKTKELIVDIADKYASVNFFDYEDTPAGWVEEEYSKCKSVWVTGDSISMVYEALSSGCRVGVIPVKWKKVSNKFVKSENFLRENGYVHDLDTHLNKETTNEVNVLSEADRCAEEILRRWG